MEKIKVFISSVQNEFSFERQSITKYIREDYMFGKFFTPFIFEELPAININAQDAYFTEVSECDIYIGIYGRDYGFEDKEGISPTEREYNVASKYGKHRIIFIKRVNNRHPIEDAFISKVENDVVRKSYETYEELKMAVYASLVRYLEEKEILRLLPWDASYHPTATMNDIDEEKVSAFIDLAQKSRGFPLGVSAGIKRILSHLDLMSDDGRPTNAALLLFSKKPQKFFLTSEVKCAQFYGNSVCKPIPAYQVFHGSIFEIIDQAVGFVMSRINVGISDRSQSVVANVEPEIPLKVVTEAIVNACTHRDYSSNGSVQVMLFKNRLEVWNPGVLPYGLTTAKLLQPHVSMPTNPILANPMYLAGYIERIGTGTSDMLDACRIAGLRDPEFIQDSEFRVIIWRKELHSDTQNLHSDTQNLHSDTQNLHSDNYEDKIKTLTKKQKLVLDFCVTPKTSHEIIEFIGVKYQTRSIKQYVTNLVSKDLLRPVIPGSLKNRNQKYVAVTII